MQSLRLKLQYWQARAIKLVVEFCDNTLLRDQDGIAVNLSSRYGELLRELAEHAQNEGAVETLRRIIRERDKAMRIVDEVSRRACTVPPCEGWEGHAAMPVDIDKVVIKRTNSFGDGTTGGGAA